MSDGTITTSDGTVFSINSEQVRGEPRCYWLERRDAGEHSSQTDGAYDATFNRRTAQRRLAKRAREWEAAL